LQRSNKYKAPCFKIHILNDKTAIAFSGVVRTALNIISQLYDELANSPDLDVPNRVLELSQQASDDCDFLILQLTATGKRLAKISRNNLSYCERAYIGDANEYAQMIKLKNALPIIPDPTLSQEEIEFDEVSNAMEQLVQQRKSQSVGAICNCIIRIVDARISGALEYLQLGSSTISPEEGLGGFSFLASNVNVRGMGVYYRVGKLGFLFIVGDSQNCRKIYTETLNEFIQIAKTNYGLNLTGVTW
jgi:hypothetical protein